MEQRSSLWTTREHAMTDLNGAMAEEAAALGELFSILDEVLEDLKKFFEDSELGRVSALIGVKGRNLALACYSLALDGLAQESGAILRLLLEVIELLAYLLLDPERVAEVIDDKLPGPGKRAKKVDGKFEDLRRYLNRNASHISLSYESMRHTVDLDAGRLRVVQPHRPSVLRINMGTLCMFTSVFVLQISGCFEHLSATSGKARVTAESHLNKIRRASDRARSLFFPEAS